MMLIRQGGLDGSVGVLPDVEPHVAMLFAEKLLQPMLAVKLNNVLLNQKSGGLFSKVKVILDFLPTLVVEVMLPCSHAPETVAAGGTIKFRDFVSTTAFVGH